MPLTASPGAPTRALGHAPAFFEKLRHSDVLGPVLTRAEVDGANAILAAAGKAGWGVAWTAAGLANAFHETAGEMVPVIERGGAAYFRRKYDIQGLNPAKARELGNLTPGDGALYCGRGGIQITGRRNYLKAEQALGLPLVAHPEIALKLDVSARILVWGLETGSFTGKSLAHFLPREMAGTARQFRESRRCVNGLDDADLIAGYALIFQDALSLGGWA